MDSNLLARQLNIHPLVAKLLVDRGYADVQSARAFLYPSLDALTPLDRYDGLTEIADRLERAIADGEGIVIFGDYDCDGICATSILYLYLKSRGADVSYFIPSRHEDGYGITYGALDKIAENSDAHILISVDCGITAVEQVAYAQDELGFEVLITDHHQPGEVLPDCPVFDPHLSKGKGCFAPLCGAGIALRLVEKMGGLQASKKYYDIAALATVADVVPLVGDNRIIVHFGLMLINSRFRRGITMLVDACVKGKVGAYDIAFRLAPRINAMGRVKEARETVELFVCDDAFLLGQLVKEIEEANAQRQQLTDDLTDDCLDRLKCYDFRGAKIIVAYAPYWDEGVLGIAAARIVGKFNRPAILLTRSGDRLKGSGRSIPGVNILDCVRACSRWLEGFGGHTMACGLSLKEQDLTAFTIALNEYAGAKYGDEAFGTRVQADAVIDRNITPEIAEQIDMLAPFGEGNPAPVFAIDCNECNFAPIGDGSHLKGRAYGMEVLDFFAADDLAYLNGGAKKRLIVDIQPREFNNVKRAEAIVRKVIAVEMPSREECAEHLLKISAASDSAEDATIEPWSGDFVRGDGTLFVAFDPEKGKKFAEERSLPIYFGETPDLTPTDAVVVCPRKPLPYYRNAVFLDEPLLGATAALIAPSAKSYSAQDRSFVGEIAAHNPSAKEYAAVYKAVRAACYAGTYTSPDALYAAVKHECGVDKIGFAACICVFSALKFLRIGAKIECVKVEKTSLDASGLYRALQRAGKTNG